MKRWGRPISLKLLGVMSLSALALHLWPEAIGAQEITGRSYGDFPVATVQTGIHVGPLVKGLAREGFMAPFGDSPTVGIGGITMGGGFGVLSRSIGLISDNLLALKMVDAKGRIIQANQSRNEDLLWASRGGGGGNFGYNTQYTFKVHRAPKTATVFNIIWPWEQLETVFKAWQKWAPFTDERLGSTG